MIYDEELRAKLLEKNILVLFNEINEQTASILIKDALNLQLRWQEEGVPESRRKITLLLSTPGGSISAGFAIFDFFLSLKCEITTVGIGLVASMGVILLCLGKARLAFKHAELMTHQPLTNGLAGRTTEIETYAQRMVQLKKRLNQILAETCNKPIEVISDVCEKDTFFNAQEALDFGLITEVIDDLQEVVK